MSESVAPPAEPVAAVAPEAETGTPAQPEAAASSENDFEAKFIADPKAGLEQFKKLQRENAQMFQRLKTVEPLVPVAEQLGGADAVIRYLRDHNGLLTNAQMREIVTRYQQTGEVPRIATSDAEVDPYAPEETPEAKEIKALRAELSELRQQTTSIAGRSGVDRFQGFINEFLKSAPFSEEEKTKVVSGLMNQAQAWAKDANGVRVLENADQELVSRLARAQLTVDDWLSIGERQALKKQQNKTAAATDQPVRGASRAAETPAKMNPADAFVEACRRFGADPMKPLGAQ